MNIDVKNSDYLLKSWFVKDGGGGVPPPPRMLFSY